MTQGLPAGGVFSSAVGGAPVGGAPVGGAPVGGAPVGGGLSDLFGLQGGLGVSGAAYVHPKEVWLPAQKGKGLEVSGTFSRRQNQLYMDLTFSNRAMQPMGGFAIQFNRNR